MRIIQPHIYLASQSPRRRELLKQIGINFEMLLLRSDSAPQYFVDEVPHPGEQPESYVRRVAQAKAESGYSALRFRNLPAVSGAGGGHHQSRWTGRSSASPTTSNRPPRCCASFPDVNTRCSARSRSCMDEHIEVAVSARRCASRRSAKNASGATCCSRVHRQGRRLCDPGLRRGIHRTSFRQLLRRDGPAAV